MNTATPSTPPTASAPTTGRRARRGHLGLWTIAVVGLLLGILVSALVMRGAARRDDFAHYYLAARMSLTGEDPYRIPLGPLCEEHGFSCDARISHGAHPPLLVATMAQLAWMSPATAYAAWALLEVLALLALLELTRRVVRWKVRAVPFWLFSALVLCSTASQSHFFYSQVQFLIAAVITAAWLARISRHHLLACGLVVGAASFKLYPAVLLPWFVFTSTAGRRDWLHRLGVAIAVALGVVAVTGLAAWLSFLQHALPVIYANDLLRSPTNYSIQAALLGVLGWSSHLAGAPVGDDVARPLVSLSTAAAVLGVYAVLFRHRSRLAPHAPLCILVITMILCGPVAWAHYLVLMTPVAALLFRSAGAFAGGGMRVSAYVVAVVSLMPALDVTYFDLGLGGTLTGWLVHYYPLYALIVSAVLFWRLPRPASAAVDRTMSRSS